jgi:hypothetical protein
VKRAFIYHETDDAALADELALQLFPLGELGARLLKVVKHSEKPPGADNIAWLQQEVNEAHILLLVVTARIFNPFTFTEFAEWVFTRRQKGECIIIPVIFKSCQWQFSPFGPLKSFPIEGDPIEKSSDKDSALNDIADFLAKEIVPKFEKFTEDQLLEVEKLKAALSVFNFYDQITPNAAADFLGGCFKVLTIKGNEDSGHNLLAWRWRNEIAKIPAVAKLPPLKLTETDATIGDICTQVQLCVSGAMASQSDPSSLANVLVQRLQNEALALRFDYFNPGLHKTLVEDFFKQLQQALEPLVAGKPQLKPLHFFVFHRDWTNETDFEFNLPFARSLRPIGKVDKATLHKWKQEMCICGQLSGTARQRIELKEADIVDNDIHQNDTLKVLDRLSRQVFAKQQLYDNHILTLE